MKLNSIKVSIATLVSVLMAWAGIAAGESSTRLDAETVKSLNRSMKGLYEHQMPDGSVHMHLDGRFRHATFARVNASGEVEQTCTADVEHAELLISDALPAAEAKRVLPALTPTVMPTQEQQR